MKITSPLSLSLALPVTLMKTVIVKKPRRDIFMLKKYLQLNFI